MRARLLTAAGLLLLGMGGVGLLLPVWPTTPFVLAAAGCFSSNPAMRDWLYRSTFFREYLENGRTRCGISNATRNRSLLFLWGMLLLSACLMGRSWLWLLLLAVGVAVTWHILWISRPRGR